MVLRAISVACRAESQMLLFPGYAVKWVVEGERRTSGYQDQLVFTKSFETSLVRLLLLYLSHQINEKC